MKPAPFGYHRPATVEEAVELLATHDDAELVAGNQSLGIMMANRLATPSHLVDLGDVDALAGIDVGEGVVALGAIATHRDVERHDGLREAVPMFPLAAGQIAGPAVRNRGTVGGSLGEADPAGNYPTCAVALGATLRLVGPDGPRDVPAEEFFLGSLLTDLEHAELIARVTVDRGPFPTDRTGMAFEELKPAAQTWPTVSAGAAVRVDDPEATTPSVEAARLALANVADVPLRVEAAEAAVEGRPPADATLDEAAGAVEAAVDPQDELHADATFKTEVAGEFARRALRAAYDRAIGG